MTTTVSFAARAGGAVLDAFAPRGEARLALAAWHRVEAGRVDAAGCFCRCAPQAAWTVQNTGSGRATIDLGNHLLVLDEAQSQIRIVNKSNGEVTRVWGDPHIDWNRDGRTDADFWTKTTFVLEDGTKVTIDTEPWKGQASMYVASEVTVTRGEQAIRISGLSQNQLGDLSITQHAAGGALIDWAVTDGFVVHENRHGEGWINPATGRLATQADFDITRPGAVRPYEFWQGLGQLLGLYLVSGIATGLLLGAAALGGWREGRVHAGRREGDGGAHGACVQVGVRGAVTVEGADGRFERRSGGSLAWRTRNPGLLPLNALTRAMGAIGEVQGVAVFAIDAQGRAALARMLAI